MYPPPTATILAPLTVLGPIPFTLIVDVLNAAAWVSCVLLSVYLITGRARGGPPALYAVPVICCLAYVWDTYQLGQLNLVL